MDELKEVTHICVVQTGAVVGDGDTESKGASSEREGIEWVTGRILWACGGVISVTHEPIGAHVTSSEGPVHGWVISV